MFSLQNKCAFIIQRAWRRLKLKRLEFQVIWYSNNSIISVIHGKFNHLILWSDFRFQIDCKGREFFVFENTSCYTPRQSGFWVGCVDALKLPKRCEKVAAIRRWALWGGCSSWDEGIVGMWRLLKGNRCWENSRYKERTIFKTLAAAVLQKKNIPLIYT